MLNATTQSHAVEIAKRYYTEVSQHIHVSRMFLFGSFAKGTQTKDSDIDIAVVASDFKNDPVDDYVLLLKLRRSINLQIEPHPFIEEEFTIENPFAREIIQSGIAITEYTKQEKLCKTI